MKKTTNVALVKSIAVAMAKAEVAFYAEQARTLRDAMRVVRGKKYEATKKVRRLTAKKVKVKKVKPRANVFVCEECNTRFMTGAIYRTMPDGRERVFCTCSCATDMAKRLSEGATVHPNPCCGRAYGTTDIGDGLARCVGCHMH